MNITLPTDNGAFSIDHNFIQGLCRVGKQTEADLGELGTLLVNQDLDTLWNRLTEADSAKVA